MNYDIKIYIKYIVLCKKILLNYTKMIYYLYGII